MLSPREYYQPFQYPWAFDSWQQHEGMHWMGKEVSLSEDVNDWQNKLTEEEKGLMTNLFRFFTQGDISVAEGYAKHFLPYFCHKPELTMMMSSIAAREAIHVDAYALLLETVGMDEGEYSAFHSFKAMRDKYEFSNNFDMSNPYEVCKTLAVYSAFTEGMQLFGSFIILLNFPRVNKMKNMGTVIAWSIRDEDLHVDFMTQLFRTFREEAGISKEELAEDLSTIMTTMVGLEDAFIDLCFGDSDEISGLKKEEVKRYIRFVCNGRIRQLDMVGHMPEFDIETNPLPWVDEMVNGKEHVNFFEQKSTAYARGQLQGSMEEIDWS